MRFGLAVSAMVGLAFSFTAAAGEVQILDAMVKDKAIPGAEIILQKPGESSLKATTGANGRATLPAIGADDANVTLIVKSPGFSNLVAKCPCSGMTYAMSPVMADLDGLRIVLHWGDTPADLDSHLYSADEHIFFEHRDGALSELDVDDVDYYGPETVTLRKKVAGHKYLYAVHNYSEGDQKGTATLSANSRATVYVYIGSTLMRTFTPPSGTTGNTWVVFGIGDNGEFYDINKFADLSKREQVGKFMRQIVNSGNFQSLPVLAVDALEGADRLNKQGEREYHAGNYEAAERLYLDAVNKNPEFAQAYSNLGLLYQKTGKSAEGLFANRKAIALASGSTKAVVQASSYYNIARIYEGQNAWADALANYQSALALREHKAYRDGIARAQQHLSR